MADREPTLADRLEAALPYVLPVIGGLLGVIWVNLNRMDFLNPIVAIVLGVVAGRLAATGIIRLMQRGR